MTGKSDGIEIERVGDGYQLRSEIVLNAPLDKVFAFFSDAGNLATLTPPSVKFKILSPQPINMGVGAVIDYRILLKFIPMRWRSEITVWEPPLRFADEQRKGPYTYWIHEHRFEALGETTRASDLVRYQIPGGPLKHVVHSLIVGPELHGIFDFRHKKMTELFGTA